MKRSLLLILIVLAGFLSASSQEICENGVDDDGDGLVDLKDPDCKCSSYPILKNPSFEKISDCPVTYSQLHFANNWMQPTNPPNGSTDLFHKCGNCNYKYSAFLTPMPLPIPDGVGFVGFFDIENWIGQGAYKEHITQCMDEDFEKDSFYVIDVYFGFINPVTVGNTIYFSSSPLKVSLFGSSSCNSLPYGNANTYKSCPMVAGPQWIELAKLTVTGTSGQWVRARAEFKAPANISAIVFGPSCETNVYGTLNWSYHLSDQLLVFKKREFDIPTITQSGELCTELTLTADITIPAPGATWQWYKEDIALPGETQTTLKINRWKYGTGDYKVRMKANGQTYLSPEEVITVNEAGFHLPDTVAFCQNVNVTLKPEFLWKPNDCPVSYRWSTGSVDPTLSVNMPGSYWFETNDNGCLTRDTVEVIAYDTPNVDLGDDSTLCPGQSLLLSASNPGLSYLWQDYSNNQTYLVSKQGKYYVKVSNAYCSTTDTIAISYDKLPSVKFSGDSLICNAEQKQLTPMADGKSFLWNTGATTPSIVTTLPGLYTLQVTNNCGVAKDSFRLIKADCRFYLPNAFTPNHDGLNDAFGLKNFSFVRKLDLRIYNRWGELVFHTANPAVRWNGYYKGKEQPAGIYAWIATYKDWTDAEYTEKGTVLIIR